MPLLRFDLVAGRAPEALTTLLDAAHAAVVEAFEVPDGDRYQVVHQHAPGELVVHDTGLGIPRTDDVIVLQVTSRPRTREQKERFYALLVDHLERACGTAPGDVVVAITENSDADWSFGHGRAQFLTGEL
ncbi:tautomerase family protein [Kineococcus sp. SYSU DK018]|uniref:tautomerase family protein n=1 Tax=Kineococcus sp. SYSU DK018 TaxID=3383139 RepID=UPI003D7D5D7B